MNKVKVLVNGCNGRMGQEVVSSILENDDLEIMCGFDQKDLGIYHFPVHHALENILDIPDVIIDFSVPVATLNILKFAKQNKVPTVIATTGFSEDDFNILLDYSKYIPLFQSYNMSFDIFLFQKVLSMVAPNLKDADIEIVESHHNRKIDSPSGTALMLANSINKSCDDVYHYNFNRLNEAKKREKNEIGFSSIRGGNIVGEHTVKFIGSNETFEITHTSYSRKVFAEGAIKAAKFLLGKPCGFYHMDDMLN